MAKRSFLPLVLGYGRCTQTDTDQFSPMRKNEDCAANKVKSIPLTLPLSVQDSRNCSGLIVTKLVYASLTAYR